MAWGEEFKGGKFLSTKQGNVIEGTIKEITRVQYDETTDKFDKSYSTQKEGSKGYWDRFTMDNGDILDCGTWALAKQLAIAGVDVGSKIRITHPEKGVYKVEVSSEEVPF